MAVPVVKSFTNNTPPSYGGNVILTKPTGGDAPAVGDLLILLAGNSIPADGPNFAAITGWTKQYEYGGANPDTNVVMYYRVADGTESATETVDWSAIGNSYGGGWYLVVTGADETTPVHLEGTAATEAFTGSLAAPSITTTVADCLVFAHYAFDGADGNHGVSGTNWPSAYPTNQFIKDGVTGAMWCGGWVTQDLATAGASNDCTFTSDVSDGMVTVQLAIAGASAGGGATLLETTNYQGMNRMNGGMRS